MLHILKLDFASLIRERDFDGILALIISKIPLIVTAVIIVVAGAFISKGISKLIIKALVKHRVDPSVHRFISTIVKCILNLVFVLTAFSTLGMNVNSFVAAIAAGGVTAGLGLQQSVSQFASGIQILINHPFRSGDFIDIGSVSGTVKEIRFMYTVLVTIDNKRVIVPNSHITDSNIINFNAEQKRRIDLIYSIAYDADIAKARAAIEKAANNHELIYQDPAPDVAVWEHGQSSINLVCHVWCDSKNYWPVFYYMQEQVKLEFDKEGISIPFNQLDLHITEEALNDKSADKAFR